MRMTTGAIRRAVLMLLLATMLLGAGCASVPSAPTPGATGAPAPSSVPEGVPQGTATVDGEVQRIAIDLSKGYYDPTIVSAKAGVPLEITFGQGQGCLASVLVPDFGVNQDLTAGPAVVKLPGMEAGEYEFSCGMRMVFGKIVVR